MVTCHNNIEDDEADNSKQYKAMLTYGLDKEEPQKQTINYAALFIWAAIITFFIMFALITAFNLFFPY